MIEAEMEGTQHPKLWHGVEVSANCNVNEK